MIESAYLDNNATTRVDSRVVQAMLAELAGEPSNPSSIHASGQLAKNRLTRARRQIGAFLGCKPSEIIFTSGGTEAINLLIRGMLGPVPCGHIVTSSVEHAAVFQTLEELQGRGCEVTYLSPGSLGALTKAAVEGALRPTTKLIVLMSANNETGARTDLQAIAGLAKERKIPLIVDAVASLGKEPLEIYEGIAGMAFSGHKIHGPKGVGAAYLRQGTRFTPQITGGGQEGGKRSGTENLAGILGFAAAIEIVQEELSLAMQRMSSLRDLLEQELMERLEGVYINAEAPRVCNVSNLSFEGVEGESLLLSLDMAHVAASHGAACSSGALEPSRVLVNMGLEKSRVRSAVRFSLSRETTEEEIFFAVRQTVACVQRLRGQIGEF